MTEKQAGKDGRQRRETCEDLESGVEIVHGVQHSGNLDQTLDHLR